MTEQTLYFIAFILLTAMMILFEIKLYSHKKMINNIITYITASNLLDHIQDERLVRIENKLKIETETTEKDNSYESKD
jgi:hypothetical protein